MSNEQVLFSLPLAKLEPIFKQWFHDVINDRPHYEQPKELDPEPHIYGIKGLAKFLSVSFPTAQKIKNSGKIPFSQVERTIIFSKAEVLEALKKKGGIKRNG